VHVFSVDLPRYRASARCFRMCLTHPGSCLAGIASLPSRSSTTSVMPVVRPFAGISYYLSGGSAGWAPN